MAKIQIKNSFITSSAQITISSSLVRFSDNIRAKGITGSFSGSFAGSNLFVQGGNSFGTTALLGTNDNQPLVLETNASEKMRVTAAGLVGIGTSNPGTKLQVLGDATVGTPGSGGNLWILGDRDWRFIAGTTGYGVGSGFGLFDNTGGAYRIAVDPNGNIGIGTTSPSTPLHVFNTAATLATFTRDLATDVGFSIGADSNGTIFSTAGAHAYLFYTNGTEKMRIASGGNVGIGTSSPSGLLDVRGSLGANGAAAGVSAYFVNNQAGATSATIYIGSSAGIDWKIGKNVTGITNNNNFSIVDSNNNRRFDIDSSGNIGIGTTSPGNNLVVYNGSGWAGTDLNGTSGGELRFLQSGTLKANIYASTSTALVINSGDATIFQIGASEKMRLTGGNLGIGTSSPAAFLDIVGNGIQTILRNTSGTSYTSLRLYNDQNSAVRALEIDYSGASYSGALITSGPTGESAAITTTGAYPLAFGTNNTARMTILSGGNVGIGTNSPTQKLEVIGAGLFGSHGAGTYSLAISNNDQTNARIRITNSGAGGRSFSIVSGNPGLSNAGFAIYDETSAATRMYISGSGNVGIGTTSPNTLLNVHGANPFVRINDTSATGHGIKISYNNSDTHGLHLTYNGNGAQSYIDNTYGVTSGQPYGDIYFRQNVSGVMTTRMTIKADGGSIGIGTTNPTVKLAVSDGTTIAQVNPYSGVAYFGTVNNYPMALSVNSSEKVRIDANGNVGIGTTSPGYKLDVVSGSMRASSGAYAGELYFGTNSNADLYLKRDNNYDLSLVQNASSGNALYLAGAGNVYVSIDSNNNETDRAFIVQNNSVKSGTELFRVNEAGNVGIGSSSPSAKLDVVDTGNFFVTRDANAYPRFTVTNGSAQLGLFRTGTSVGGFYIGGDASLFSVWDSSFSRLVNINTSGNIGINVASPLTKLDIANTQANGITMRYDTTTNYQAWIRPYWNSSTDTRIDFAINRTSGATPDVIMSVGYAGNVGIGTNAPIALLDVRGNTKFGSSLSNTHQFTGSVNFGGSTYNNSIAIDKFEYFSLQPYIEGGSFPSNVFSLSGTFPTFVTMTGSACPFGKVAYNVSYYEAIGDFIPVQAGETLYGEIWAYRSAGATGTAGVFYCGIARYDKDKRAIDGNAGLNYFIVSAATVPSNSTWTKYSNTTTLPLTHTPYAGSDGGPVRYVRPYIIVNYTAGTVPTYWAAFKIRKQQLTRDSGTIFISGSVGIGVSTPAYPLHVRTSANTGTIAIGNVTYPGLISTNAGSGEFRIDNRTSAAAGYITFYPNGEAGSAGSEAMRIITNGNVGIGTSSPAYKLDVNTANDSAIRIRNGGGGANNGLALSVGSGSPWLDITEGVEFRIKGNTYANIGTWNSGNNTKLLIDSNGNIGIGTTTVGAKLQVQGKGLIVQGITGTPYWNNNSFEIQSSGGNGVALEFHRAGYTSATMASMAGELSFYTDSGSERMRIVAGTGNVGIGTTNPTYKLHLSGSMLITGVGSGFSTPGSEAGYRLKFYDNGGVNNDTGIGLDGGGSGSEVMWFNALQGFYWNIGTGGEKMRLTSVGNLGIGTSSPSATLTVIATNNTGSRIQLGTASTSTFMDANKVNDFMVMTAPYGASPASVSNGGAKWGIKMNGSIDSINTKAKSAAIYAVSEENSTGYNRMVGLALHTSGFDLENSEKVRIKNDGNVGIGTTNPAAKLDVVGSLIAGGVDNGSVIFYRNTNPGTIGSTDTVLLVTDRSNSDWGIMVDKAGYDYGLRIQTSNAATNAFAVYDGSTYNARIYGTGGGYFLGDISIGTSSTPSARLRLASSNNSRVLWFTGATTGYTYGQIDNSGGSYYIGMSDNIGQFWGTTPYAGYHATLGTSANIPLTFATNNLIRVLLDNNGNLGIGSTAPAYKLDVNGTFRSTGDLWTNGNIVISRAGAYLYINGTNSDAEIVWQANGSNRWAAGMNVGDATENFNIYNYTTATTNFTILKANGNVGIGSTAPAYKLDVNGVIASSGTPIAWFSGNYNRIFEPAGNPALYLGNNSDPANYYDNGTHFFRNRGGSSTYAVIEGNGNLGIGTTSVTAPLHIYRASNPWIRLNGGGNFAYIRFDDGTSNGYLFKNTSSDTSNGALAGAMYTYTDSGKAFQHIHSGTPLFTILSGGNIGVGLVNPLHKLQASGLVSASDPIYNNDSTFIGAILNNDGTNPGLDLRRWNGGAPGTNNHGATYIATNSLGDTLFYNGLIAANTRATNEKMRISVNGNVGIGTTSPAQKLHVVGAVYGTTYGQFGTSVASGTNSSYAVFGSNSAVVGVKINIDSNVNRNDLVVSGSTGNVGIGTSQVLSKLNAYASGSNLSVFRVDGGNGTLFEVTDQLSGSLFSVNDVSGLPLLEVFSNNRVVAGKYGTNALVVSGSSVGIGTSRPAYRLQVSGSFAATTKSFVINHPDPAKSDKQLVHGVTEGPEHSVFVRGKLLNNNIIQLPDYWQYLVDADTITVTLTPNKYYQQLYVKNVTDKSIEVGSETDKPINCYYYIVGERKDIPKLITEI